MLLAEQTFSLAFVHALNATLDSLEDVLVRLCRGAAMGVFDILFDFLDLVSTG